MPGTTPTTPLTIRPSEADEKRFYAKVALPNGEGCMLWMAYVDPRGYGRFGLHSKAVKAHQVAYILANGPIPEGLHIDHVRANGCTNRHCVAPLHLEAVTPRENLLRGQGFAASNARKTHCPQRHEYVDENTYTDGLGRRYCRTCRQARDRGENPSTYVYDPTARRSA